MKVMKIRSLQDKNVEFTCNPISCINSDLVWLSSLFYGISYFVGYLLPNLFLLNEIYVII